MKTARALTLKTLALAAGLLVAPTASHAELFTYDYVGNNFVIASAPYTTNDNLSGWFTVDLTSNLSLPETDIIAILDSFSFSDGQQTITDTNVDSIVGFDIETDASGAITQWFISLIDDAPGAIDNSILTSNLGFNVADSGTLATGGVGLNFSTPGAFALKEIPEPSSFALFALALGGLGFVMRKRPAE